MRRHLLSLFVGGLLLVGGYVVGAASGLPASEAGVAFDPLSSSRVITFGAESDQLTIWHQDRDSDAVTGAVRYRLELVGGEPRIVRTVYFPSASPKGK